MNVAAERANAATRIFDHFTKWLKPGRMYCIEMTPSGRVAVRLSTPRGVRVFHGADVQDACAQAAQTIAMNGEE